MFISQNLILKISFKVITEIRSENEGRDRG
jgi:hypothetical protein